MAGGTSTMKFKVGGSAKKAEAGSAGYAGEMPPAGAYRVKLKRFTITDNKNDEPMIQGVGEINEPKDSPNAKYNGYGIWFQQNVTDQGAGYVNGLLDAMAGDEFTAAKLRDAFWDDGVKVKEDEKKSKSNKPIFHVLRIGDFKVGSPKGEVEVIFVCKVQPKRGTNPERLTPTGYTALENYVRSDGDEVVDDDELANALGGDEDDDDDMPEETPAPAKKKGRAKPKPEPEPDDDDDDDDDNDDGDDDDDTLTDDDLV